ncbi:MAG: hypothetical protein Q4F60_03105 [Candidatus Saccharibacteria bacterium]|nr:hypothetical protein [Candidatus Saccharibacteria bacterium]
MAKTNILPENQLNPPTQPAPNYKHPHMSISDRAKQFMPFSALGSLELALQKKEWEVEEKLRLKDRIEKSPE